MLVRSRQCWWQRGSCQCGTSCFWLVSSALFDCSNNYLITPESIQILQFFQISKFATSTFHCDLGSRHSQSPIQSISQFSRANVLILLLPTAGETAGLFSAGT